VKGINVVVAISCELVIDIFAEAIDILDVVDMTIGCTSLTRVRMN